MPELRVAQDEAPGVVIDTNVVLDWLVFANDAVRPWVRAIESGQLVWWSCPAMREELQHMLLHPSLERWAPDAPAALADYDRFVRTQQAPAPAMPGLRCRDSDDQVFIDLALERRAGWLVTRDRALLALARRARRHGLHIVVPEAWTG